MSTSTNHFNLLSYLNCYVKEKRKIAMHHFERLTSFFVFFLLIQGLIYEACILSSDRLQCIVSSV